MNTLTMAGIATKSSSTVNQDCKQGNSVDSDGFKTIDNVSARQTRKSQRTENRKLRSEFEAEWNRQLEQHRAASEKKFRDAQPKYADETDQAYNERVAKAVTKAMNKFGDERNKETKFETFKATVKSITVTESKSVNVGEIKDNHPVLIHGGPDFTSMQKLQLIDTELTPGSKASEVESEDIKKDSEEDAITPVPPRIKSPNFRKLNPGSSNAAKPSITTSFNAFDALADEEAE